TKSKFETQSTITEAQIYFQFTSASFSTYIVLTKNTSVYKPRLLPLLSRLLFSKIKKLFLRQATCPQLFSSTQ
ncbi:MAG: hypothetical protein ACXWW0_13995, partial [Bacteroidia bacterium]